MWKGTGGRGDERRTKEKGRKKNEKREEEGVGE